MPTWRITYPPRCYPGALLVEDVEADELVSEATGTTMLVAWVCVVNSPRRVVVRRLSSSDVVEVR